MRATMFLFLFLVNAQVVAQEVEESALAQLNVGQWQLVGNRDSMVLGDGASERRRFSWMEGEDEVRYCYQYRYGKLGLGNRLVDITNDIFDLDCDFVTYIDGGWGLMPKRYRSRKAYLQSQSRWSSE